MQPLGTTGVLFLDELGEAPVRLLDALRRRLRGVPLTSPSASPSLSVEARQLVEALENFVQAAIRESRPGP